MLTKAGRRLGCALLAALLLTACGAREDISQRCLEIGRSCRAVYEAAPKESAESLCLSRAEIDEVEQWLIAQGYPTLDSREDFPTWLANPESLYEFWDRVRAGEEGELTFLRVEDTGLACWCLTFDGEAGECTVVEVSLEGEPQITRRERRPVYDWELTERGNFYLKILPSDGHRVDYTVLRLTPPEEELWELTRTYIAPVGYLATNLFLCDWSEDAFGELSFNDVFEYLYELENGEAPDVSGYPRGEQSYLVRVPAAVFEETVLPYFALSREELRQWAMYDENTDSYPWRELQTYDYVDFRFLESEVEAYSENPDGTLTLTVCVRYPEKKLDCLFRHEVTVRPLPEGGFQYTANWIMEVSELGMPSAKPRLDRAG